MPGLARNIPFFTSISGVPFFLADAVGRRWPSPPPLLRRSRWHADFQPSNRSALHPLSPLRSAPFCLFCQVFILAFFSPQTNLWENPIYIRTFFQEMLAP
jgi:hypothetical protein